MRRPRCSTAICAEPRTWPAGWKVTVTSPMRIGAPKAAASLAAGKPSPRRIAMMSRVSRVASTAPWPPVAWSECAWVTSARATGRVGSMWKSPGGQ